MDTTTLQRDLQDEYTSIPFIGTLLLRLDGDHPQIRLTEVMSDVCRAQPPNHFTGFQRRRLYLPIGQNVL